AGPALPWRPRSVRRGRVQSSASVTRRRAVKGTAERSPARARSPAGNRTRQPQPDDAWPYRFSNKTARGSDTARRRTSQAILRTAARPAETVQPPGSAPLAHEQGKNRPGQAKPPGEHDLLLKAVLRAVTKQAPERSEDGTDQGPKKDLRGPILNGECCRRS